MEIKRTGSSDFPDRLKVMISGPPKSGKTSLLGTVPNIVIADTEPFANNLQSIAHKNIPYVTISSLDDLRGLLIVLRDDTMRAKAATDLGLPEIEAVAIDTLDTLQQIMKAERLRETRQTQFLRDDWAWIKEEMTSILRAFTALPLHVFFIVHTKTQELGRGDDSRTVVLPGLQGSIAEDIAGMVGYSMLAFRKQEIRPDGSPYTKYWLRAEGDETYAFLGNRAAGRLPDVIEPSFEAIYEAAMGGKPEGNSAPVQIARTEAHTEAKPEAKATNDDEPVNSAALTHTKKVYDAIGFTFPEDKVKALTMKQARDLVRMWQACQADAAEGKLESPVDEMRTYIVSHDLCTPDDRLNLNSAKLVISGPIKDVLAYVGQDPERAQEAYDAESARQEPRPSLLTSLIERGAKPPISVEAVEALAEPAIEEAATEEQAVATAEETLGGTVIAINTDDSAPCEECGGAIDDVDIAVLGRSRFKRWLCVKDYINQTKSATV